MLAFFWETYRFYKSLEPAGISYVVWQREFFITQKSEDSGDKFLGQNKTLRILTDFMSPWTKSAVLVHH